MRRAIGISILVSIACASAFACGLAENGLLDASTTVIPDVQIPEACADLDASCLGALAPGWQPVSMANGACATGSTNVTLVTDPHVLAGGCACGACTAQGAYSCTAQVPLSGGDNNCGDDPFANVAPSGCSNVNATQHLRAHATQATGTITCSASNDAGSGGVGSPLNVCVPGCGVDFCGGSSVCAMSDGHVDCPSGLTLLAYAGTDIDPHCAPCTCDAGSPGNCGGSVTAYFHSGCDAGDEAGTFAIESCNFINAQYQSVTTTLTPPDASCTLTSPTITGDASLLGEKTICCK